MREVVIVSAARTAIGTFGGAFKDVSVVDLGATVIKGVMERIQLDPQEVDDVIMGVVLQAGHGQNPTRQAALKAGLGVDVPAMSINKLCGSGMKAIHLAAQEIMLGDADVVIAGGMESMTQAPYLLKNARYGYRMGNGEMVDSMINDGLTCAVNNYHMGITAENLAEQYGITREEQDAFSALSQQRAVAAVEAGRFKDEIVPVVIPQRKGEPIVVDTDEYPKKGTTAESLAKLKPAFKKDGTVTAGNASGINDGAAAVVVMSLEKAQALGLKPLAKIVSMASAAVEPSIMGIGPVPAVKQALAKANLGMEAIELVEFNEAFAVQSLSVLKDLPFNPEIVNVNGGAIALGHPIGASGARIIVTLLHEMEKRDVKVGLASLCVGGGMGVATIIERI